MTLVQEAMSIIERMPRRNQQVVLELLRVMSNRPAFDEQPKKRQMLRELQRWGSPVYGKTMVMS